MLFHTNELLFAVSTALDFVEKELTKGIENHGKKVAYIAMRIGKELFKEKDRLWDLFSYALLHDNGVTKLLLEASESKEKIDIENNKSHCEIGEGNIKGFPFFKPEDNVILYHHEHFDGTGPFGIKGNDIPLHSRIIMLADYVSLQLTSGYSSENICEDVSAKSGTYFDPELVHIFNRLTKNVEFWLNMDDLFIESTVEKMTPDMYIETTYQKIQQQTQIFTNIIDDKSTFTRNHSKGISEKTGIICKYYNYEEDEYWQMRIAADLHDIGKLMMPNDILDKPAKLSDSEYQTIKAHTFYTRKILEKISCFENITQWAANHHEKLNGSGYPYGLSAKDLDRNSRILACIDIYQALTEDRPYRKGLTHKRSIEIMRQMAENGGIDQGIVNDIDIVFNQQKESGIK